MARIQPKTNWQDAEAVTLIDMNRIENNNQQAFSEIDGIVQGETIITGTHAFLNGLKTDNIESLGNGVSIDGVIFRDGGIIGTIWGA